MAGSQHPVHTPPKNPGPAGPRRRLLPRWRIFTWVILAFNLIMLIWVITGATTAQSCDGRVGDALTRCQAGDVGTTIGVGLIILIWALGDVILGVLWLVTRPHRRHCPTCGEYVRRGVTQCQSCGYDFAAQAMPARQRGQAPPPSPPSKGQWRTWH
jgi:hypothetical protein